MAKVHQQVASELMVISILIRAVSCSLDQRQMESGQLRRTYKDQQVQLVQAVAMERMEATVRTELMERP
jgi:hypothetical protein